MLNRKVKFLLMLTTSLLILGISAVCFAAGDESEVVQVATKSANGWIALAAGLAIGIAAFGGALAQGRAAGTALDGIARNPGASGKIMTPMILGLALIESLVIYALVIAFMLLGKIG